MTTPTLQSYDKNGQVSTTSPIEDTPSLIDNYRRPTTHSYLDFNVLSRDDEYYVPMKKQTLNGHGWGELDEQFVRRTQQHMMFYLVRDEQDDDEDEENVENADMEISYVLEEKNDGQTFQFIKIDGEDATVDYATIELDGDGVKFIVDRDLVQQSSQILAQHLIQGGIMTCEKDALLNLLHFIHMGFVGVSETSFINVDDTPNVISMDMLLKLLDLADKYQVESLLRAISRCCNAYSACLLCMRAHSLHNKHTQDIIYKKGADFIAANTACLLGDWIYEERDLSSMVPQLSHITTGEQVLELFSDKMSFLNIEKDRDGAKAMLAASYLTNICVKALVRIPFELFKLFLSSQYNSWDDRDLVILVLFWWFDDREARTRDTFDLIRNHLNLLALESEQLVFLAIFKCFVELVPWSEEKQEFIETMLKIKFSKAVTNDPELESFVLSYKNMPKRVFTENGNGVKTLMIGLDQSGKTTLLYHLKLDTVITTIPTIGFNVETVTVDNTSLTIWDVGGQDRIRPLWHHYYDACDLFIFVVDSTDRERFPDAHDEFKKLVRDNRVENRNSIKYLIMANKQDVKGAASVEEIAHALDLHSYEKEEWHVQGSVGLTGAGFKEGIKWFLSPAVGGQVLKKVKKQDMEQLSNRFGELVIDRGELFAVIEHSRFFTRI